MPVCYFITILHGISASILAKIASERLIFVYEKFYHGYIIYKEFINGYTLETRVANI